MAIRLVVTLTDNQVERTRRQILEMALERQSTTSAAHAAVAEFWQVYEYLDSLYAAPLVNHSKNPDFIAIHAGANGVDWLLRILEVRAVRGEREVLLWAVRGHTFRQFWNGIPAMTKGSSTIWLFTWCANTLMCRRQWMRMQKLMQLHGIYGKGKRLFRITTDSAHDLRISPNLLNRQFPVTEPDEAWVGDITYIPTDEGWLFWAVVIDLFSRQIVGWSMDERMKSSLVIDALRMA